MTGGEKRLIVGVGVVTTAVLAIGLWLIVKLTAVPMVAEPIAQQAVRQPPAPVQQIADGERSERRSERPAQGHSPQLAKTMKRSTKNDGTGAAGWTEQDPWAGPRAETREE